MNRKIIILKSLKGIIFFLPVVAIFLCFLNPARANRWFFTIFITLFIIERMWEAFYTSKRQVREVSEIDPTLPITLSLYVLLIIFCLTEFYLTHIELNLYVSLFAIVGYVVALILRLWAIISLRDQWSINIMDKSTIDFQKTLIVKGPYKYVRHPIYFGTILEQVSIPLVANLYYSAFLILIFSIPFHMIKAKIEEQNLISELGSGYEVYMKSTPWINFLHKVVGGEDCIK